MIRSEIQLKKTSIDAGENITFLDQPKILDLSDPETRKQVQIAIERSEALTASQKLNSINALRAFSRYNGRIQRDSVAAYSRIAETSGPQIYLRSDVPLVSLSLVHELNHFEDNRKLFERFESRGLSREDAVKEVNKIFDSSTGKLWTEANSIRAEGGNHFWYASVESMRTLATRENLLLIDDITLTTKQQKQRERLVRKLRILLPPILEERRRELLEAAGDTKKAGEMSPLSFLSELRGKIEFPVPVQHSSGKTELGFLQKVNRMLNSGEIMRNYAPRMVKDVSEKLKSQGWPAPEDPGALFQAEYQFWLHKLGNSEEKNKYRAIERLSNSLVNKHFHSFFSTKHQTIFSNWRSQRLEVLIGNLRTLQKPPSSEVETAFILASFHNGSYYEETPSFRRACLIKNGFALQNEGVPADRLNPALSRIPKNSPEISEWLDGEEFPSIQHKLNALVKLREMGHDVGPDFYKLLSQNPEIFATSPRQALRFLAGQKEWQFQLRMVFDSLSDHTREEIAARAGLTRRSSPEQRAALALFDKGFLDSVLRVLAPRNSTPLLRLFRRN